MKKFGVVAFAFGVPAGIRSNRIIAILAKQKAQELESPVYTQMGLCSGTGLDVEHIVETPDNLALTLRLARGAIEWARRRGITELLVVAARPALWRSVRDLKYAAQEAKASIEVRACQTEIGRYPQAEWFCTDSVQLRTRSRLVWWLREILLWFTPMSFYKLIAS